MIMREIFLKTTEFIDNVIYDATDAYFHDEVAIVMVMITMMTMIMMLTNKISPKIAMGSCRSL